MPPKVDKPNAKEAASRKRNLEGFKSYHVFLKKYKIGKVNGKKLPTQKDFNEMDVSDQEELNEELEEAAEEIRNKIADDLDRLRIQNLTLDLFGLGTEEREFVDLDVDERKQILGANKKTLDEMSAMIEKVEDIFLYHMDESGAEHRHAVDISESQGRTPIGTTSKTYQDVQALGQAYGCWECGAFVGDENSWIADHIPPFNLRKGKLKGLREKFSLSASSGFTLYPSCKKCSSKQSALVRKINNEAGYWDTIEEDDDEYKLLFGGDYPNNPVATNGRSTAAAHKAWNGVKKIHCHICKGKQSHDDDASYVADHYPPREFNTSYAGKLFKIARKHYGKNKVKLPDPTVRPQCTSCSGKQGGRLSADTKILLKAAELFNVKAYK
jgi:hypothetical protein